MPPRPTSAALLALAAGCGFADVPGDADHGSVRRETFASEALGREAEYLVYLPPGGPRPGERLPVVYLLHGYGDGAHSWFRWGGAHETADRLIAAGEVPRLILVSVEGNRSFYANSPLGRWEDFVADEVVRVVDARHPTIASREGRALAGNSMGGYGALRLALLHPARFGGAASLSGFILAGPFLPERAERREPREILLEGVPDPPVAIYADCGDADRYGLQDQLRGLERLFAGLGDRAPPHETHLVEGSHSWGLWRERLPHALRFLGRHLRSEGGR
ncbi:MAG: esterase family protein [Planctomycetales bacterium]|nr:esterase family protein [Planctomycetales bacterium]